ncbi:spore germination protein KB [Cytobacillus eiseniae]|uniref:Spore germination protein KB n=1 Tax=Cytobacillus eiseniae TaxID=762947 RepID=A0ABS4RGL0_9BACI|nr:endospore germination permease [Cytobacillus eiseniae]MBP2240962.1 spore germination protein KB [Cytobacillus eiseniae]
MERISQYQLFVLTVFFQVGTTIIFGFGAAAGRDAWIVTIISLLVGIFVISIYLFLSYLNPGLTLVEWFPAQFGKWIGTPIAWLYPLLFLYEGGRILNDIKYLTTTIILVDTPFLAIILFFLLVVAYLQYCGIEVIARIGEIFFPYFLVMILGSVVLILVSDILRVDNLLPVLKNGWKPILASTFPLGASQGFAQSLELAMIWLLVSTSHKEIVKTTLFATVFSGLLILITVLMIITGIGEFFYKIESFPMFALVSKVNIGGIIKNLDAFAVLLFIISAFFKLSLHLFFAIRGFQILTKVESSRKLIIPITIISIYLGYSVSSNYEEHIKVAIEVFPYNLWIMLLWILPFALLIVTLIKRAIKNRKKEMAQAKE